MKSYYLPWEVKSYHLTWDLLINTCEDGMDRVLHFSEGTERISVPGGMRGFLEMENSPPFPHSVRMAASITCGIIYDLQTFLIAVLVVQISSIRLLEFQLSVSLCVVVVVQEAPMSWEILLYTLPRLLHLGLYQLTWGCKDLEEGTAAAVHQFYLQCSFSSSHHCSFLHS